MKNLPKNIEWDTPVIEDLGSAKELIKEEKFAGFDDGVIFNGNPIGTEKYEYKKNWYNSFIIKVKKNLLLNKNIIIGGDFNVIPEEKDVYNYKKYENDALFKLEIRKKFRELINLGFCDGYRFLNKDNQEYTFWDYMGGSWQKNHGMRIDHFLVSNNLLEMINSVNINKKPRSNIKPSDHTPIELNFN